MKNPTKLLLLSLAMLGLGACEKAPDKNVVKLVDEAGRSPNFEATVSHLDVGGPVFTYIETRGDVQKLANGIHSIWNEAARKPSDDIPPPPASLTPYLEDLGFHNIEAFGFSSRAEGKGFVNKTFLHTPGGPKGLLLLGGGSNKPLLLPSIAPEDIHFGLEGQLDTAQLLTVAKALMTRAGKGDLVKELDAKMDEPIPGSPDPELTIRKIVTNLNTRMLFAGKIVRDPKNANVPPHFSLAIVAENGEPIFKMLTDLIDKSGFPIVVEGKNEPATEAKEGVAAKKADNLVIRIPTPLPIPGYALSVALNKQSKRLLITTDEDTLKAWTKPAKTLATSPAWAAACQGLPASGNQLTYVSKNVWTEMPELLKLVKRLADAEGRGDEVPVEFWTKALAEMFPVDAPAHCSINQLTPDGILCVSRSPMSHKTEAWMYSTDAGKVAAIGFFAAMAVPAFEKVRTEATSKTMRNDARLVSNACQQYFLKTGKANAPVKVIMSEDYIYRLSSGVELVDPETTFEANGTFTLYHPKVGERTFEVDSGDPTN